MTLGYLASRDRDQLERAALALGSTLAPAERDAVGQYIELVASWNSKLDLSAARDTGQLIEVLVCDALMLARPELCPPRSRCLDVGSGAGAPAIPLALLRADLTLTLVEPRRKRVAFLRTVLGTLGLVARVRVFEQKLDPSAPTLPDAPFDLAFSRATFAPEAWLAASRPLSRRTLVLLANQPPPSASGCQLERVLEYSLPSSGARRRIAAYQNQPA